MEPHGGNYRGQLCDVKASDRDHGTRDQGGDMQLRSDFLLEDGCAGSVLDGERWSGGSGWRRRWRRNWLRIWRRLRRTWCVPDIRRGGARRARIALGTALRTRKGCGLRWDCGGGMSSAADLRYGLRDAAQESGIHGDCGDFAGAGHRREYGDFFRCQEPAVRPAERAACRSNCGCWAGWRTSMSAVHSMWGEFDSAPGGGMLGDVLFLPGLRNLRAHNRVLQDLFAYKEEA